MDKTKDIKKVMELCGRTACFETDGQKSDGFLCIITSTWRKNKTNFEPTATPIRFSPKSNPKTVPSTIFSIHH